MCDELSDGKVLYGLCRFKVNEVYRFVYLSWCGEGVQGMLRGLVNNHAHDMQRVFQGYHVQHNARYEDDLDMELPLKKLQSAIGAAYDAGGVIQGTQGKDPTPSRQPAKPKGPIIDSEASSKFWEQNAEQAPSSGYQKPTVEIKSSASSLKSRFEQLAEEQATEAPPPVRTGKVFVPYKAEEPAYPEESYAEESYAEESYEEASYPEESYPEESYAEESYADEAVPEESYPEESYAEEAYPEESYAEEAYEEEAYAEEAYAEEAYEEEAYEEAYEEEAYEEGYEEEGYYEEGSLGTATALYDYAGQSADDLPFSAGAIITILDQSDPSGWWKGSLDGVEGYFPSNFVQQN